MALTSHRVVSDIFNLENVVQQTGIVHGKNLIIDTLREVFRQDREFRYLDDVFGYPKIPSHLGLDPDAGLDDDETTRIFIGSTYRYDIKFNPSISVKNTGTRYVPISFNRDLLGIIYTNERIVDGYGNEAIIRSPSYHTLVGAWDQTIQIQVTTEDEVDREEIADIVMVSLQGSRMLELQREGLFIRSMNTGGEMEQEYANDKLYSISINLDTRSEWKIHIPINDVVERIGICLTLDALDTDPPADGLTINEQITSADQL